MPKKHQIQISLPHPAGAIYSALTSGPAIATWFSEFAEDAGEQLLFWGRFTPLDLERPAGGRAIRRAEPGARLDFEWAMQGEASLVEISLSTGPAGTLLALSHSTIPDGFPFWMEDFWFLSLENLRRYLAGRPAARFDFTQIKTGDYSHHLDVGAPPGEVWQALTDPAAMDRWIASNAEVDLRVGGTYSYGWPVPGPVKILELLPEKRLSTEWEGWEREPPSAVTWELEASGGNTRLTLVHSGFADDFDSSGTQIGWLNFMNWLRSSVEYGEGWVPPLARVSAEMAPFYPAPIGRAQGALVFGE